jgi:hypothetical protein
MSCICAQGTDRWQSAALFDPSDAGAAGFYALNAFVSAYLFTAMAVTW